MSKRGMLKKRENSLWCFFKQERGYQGIAEWWADPKMVEWSREIFWRVGW